MLDKLLEKLTSRKFLVTVFAILAIMMGWIPVESQYAFVIAVLGYVAGEAWVDMSRS